MIYDAAIASLKQALTCHRKNDLVKRNQFIARTQFIVQELNNTLDLQRGKDIAATLKKLYHFLNRHLGEVLSDNDIRKVEHALSLLLKLREAWQEISQKAVKEENPDHGAAIYHGGTGSVIQKTT
jgi:flagellar protein FliS